MQWARRAARGLLIAASPCLPALAHAQDVPPAVAAPPSVSAPPSVAPAPPAPPPAWTAPAPVTWHELERAPAPGEETPARWQRLVEFTADNPNAELQVHHADAGVWETVCQGPCRKWIWTPATYRVSGSGVRNSAKFGIYPEPHAFVLHAETGSSDQLAGGVVLTSVGGVTILVGLAVALVESIGCSFGSERDCRSATGPLTAVVGAGALAGGIVLIVTSKTDLLAPGPQQSARSRCPVVPLGGGFALTPRGIEF